MNLFAQHLSSLASVRSQLLADLRQVGDWLKQKSQEIPRSDAKGRAQAQRELDGKLAQLQSKYRDVSNDEMYRDSEVRRAWDAITGMPLVLR